MYIMSNNILLPLIIVVAIGIVALIVWLLLKPKQCKEFYDSGELRRVFFEKRDGKKTGKETVYYRSGEINRIKWWKLGELCGVSTVFYKTGEIYIIAHYSENLLDGPYEVFEKDGSLIESSVYSKGEKQE